LFNRIKNWFKNLFKQKCPKCKGLNISIVEKKLIDKYIKTECYDDTHPRIKHHYNYYGRYNFEETKCYEVEISVFEVKYKCNICGYEWKEKEKR